MKDIHTVNVLEIIDKVPSQLFAFPDNPQGNKEAEKLFKRMAKENGAEEKNMDSYIEDGVYEYCDLTTGVFLIHSS